MKSSKDRLVKVGIDMVEISRFKDVLKKKQISFLEKVFLKREIDYCFSYKDSATHFSGIFVAKEAVSKALGVKKYPFAEIEVRHTKDGAPVVYHNNKKLKISISITHTKNTATAIAIA